ncbi:hypothetical protein [Devosia sp.]|uniref:hypothetical protein n=1 Tax=Devosia sp. TaxID=1871048 RepID=UPI003262D39A
MRLTSAIDRATLPHLGFILFVGMPIAALLPFDPAFLAATFGSPLLRAALLAGLAIAGCVMGQRAGLRLRPHGARFPHLIALGAAIAMAIAIALLDGVLWRGQLTPTYLALFQTDLLARVLSFMSRAFNENVIYRLFVFSGLVLLLAQFWRGRDGQLALGAVLAAAILAQSINIAINILWISPGGTGTSHLAYDIIRYVNPGVLWALLYWRYGFVAAEIASVSCHIVLQPLLGYLLG